MPPKGKKSSSWYKCDVCEAILLSKIAKEHELQCPLSPQNVVTPCILLDKLYSTLEVGDIDEAKTLSSDITEDLIFISHTVIDLCNLVIGDRVSIECSNFNTAPIIRRVWPVYNVGANEVATVNQQCLDPSWLGKSNLKVVIAPFKSLLLNVDAIHVQCSDHDLSTKEEFKEYLKISQIDRIVSPTNIIKLTFFGKKLQLKILKIENKGSTGSEFEDNWFLLTSNSKWIIKHDNEKALPKPQLIIGGVDKILENICDLMKNAFEANSRFSIINFAKSILLYGPSGVGKTLICKYIAQKSNANIVEIDCSEIFSKIYGETERTLKKIFGEALKNGPSIILIDDIHILCAKKSSSTTEQEHRILSTMKMLLDNVHESNERIFILAATNKLDLLDPTLRRYGRIDCEIEIPVPSKNERLDIMKKLFSTVPHKLSNDEIIKMAYSAHGYVGADIVHLATQAAMNAIKTRQNDPDAKIMLSDVEWAFTQVKPSAMREILIHVPNVKWEEIGGQNDLKLKLRQSVEWPLKYGESFKRFGIKPPSGLLMYGPPGCSKTMIAKALATESGLNFLSIKGPELFSKWVGESERAVREVFRKARQVAPSIVFFDEIDALGSERSKQGGGSNVQERVLAQILTELDGVSPLGNVMIVAATNRPDRIDSALLRPGRLDRIVYVPLPDDETRLSIFKIKLAKMPIAENISLENLVVRTKSYSGAEIQAVCHEAALKALEEDINSAKVLEEHFEAALKLIQPRTPPNLLSIYDEFERNSLK